MPPWRCDVSRRTGYPDEHWGWRLDLAQANLHVGVHVVQFSHVGLWAKPDRFRFVGVQLQTSWLTPQVDVVCARWWMGAQQVDVVETAAVMELGVIGVELWPNSVAIQFVNDVLGIGYEAMCKLTVILATISTGFIVAIIIVLIYWAKNISLLFL